MRRPFRIALSCAILLGAFLVLQFRSPGEAVAIRRPLDTFPNTVQQWRGREGVIFELDTLAESLALHRLLGQPAQGCQPHSPRNCLPGAGWEPLEASTLVIPLPQPLAPITVNRYVIQKERDQQLVFYWYQSQGRAIAGEMAARIDMMKNSITRHRTDGALVRVSGPIYGSVQETSDRLVGYIQAMYALLPEYLPD